MEGTGNGWSRRQNVEDGIVPSRWPRVGLLARLYLRIDTTTSCQAKRNFSALSAVVSHPSGQTKSTIINMMLHKVISCLIPGVAEVLQDVAAWKVNCDAEAVAFIAAQTAAAGEVISVDEA